uniref:Uncharacterized protein n=1 Tax=Anguilla anguilla TaxID=7936 RepID=A0A0E9SBB4_ANGAN
MTMMLWMMMIIFIITVMGKYFPFLQYKRSQFHETSACFVLSFD